MSASTFVSSAMIIGGAGALGSLLARQLRDSGVGDICTLDLRPRPAQPGVRALVGDAAAPDDAAREAVSRASLVVLALPSQAASACAAAIATSLAPGALLVETLSVKARLHTELERLQPPVQYLGVNPMFAPDLGFEGRPVIVVGARTRSAEQFIGMLTHWGAQTVAMDVDAHDRALALLQALTHAAILSFGLALSTTGCDLESLSAIAPPPYRAMLALLGRMCANDPEVYRDIQEENVHAGEVRAALERAVSEIATAAPNADDFRALMQRVCGALGERQPELNAACVRMFAANS